MSIIVPDVGEIVFLTKMLINLSESDDDFELKVFTNATSPGTDAVASDFTEATFSGYVTKTLNRSNFSAPTTLGNGEAQTVYDTEQTWTVGTTGQNVYGYYVLEKDSGTLLWFESFGVNALASGDTLKITPSFTLRTRGS